MSIMNLLLGCIGTFSGYLAFIVFIVFKNYSSAVLGLITGIVGTACIFLYILARKRILFDWYSSSELKQISRLAFVFLTAGVLCLIYFSVLQIMLKTPIFPISSSLVAPIICAVLQIQTSSTLFHYSCKYRVKLESGQEELVTNGDSQDNGETEVLTES